MNQLLIYTIFIFSGFTGLFTISQTEEVVNPKDSPPVVIQLFTSQGCSSCPPADELLNKVSSDYNDEEVITLSYHVDYWNRLGWKDPFSSEDFSRKQRSYAQNFNGRVYTPQAIVNGKEQFVGSNESEMHDAIAEMQAKESKSAELHLKKIVEHKNHFTIKFSSDKLDRTDRIYAALVVDERLTSIPRGENSGRLLKNINIVASESQTKSVNSEEELKLSIPNWIKDNDELHVVLYSQKSSGEIISAIRNKVSRSS